MAPQPPASAAAPAGAPDPAVPAWLRGLPRAPEYRPTESEFADPIAFLSRVEREAAAYGICKVIPPHPRPSRRFVFAHLNRSLVSSCDAPAPTTSDPAGPSSSPPASAAVFTTRHQELGTARRGRPTPQVLKQVWQSGERYTLDQFEAKSRAFSKTHLSGLNEPSALTVESLFWKASADRPIYIEYANDVPGSGFAAPVQLQRKKKRKRESAPMDEWEKSAGWRLSNSPWNLQAIARAPGSLTRFMPDDVPGVTSPMVYIGMLFSWFAWHVEDHDLHSLNFLHTGAPKTWYAVPGDRAVELEEVIRVHGYGGNPDRIASLAVLGEKTTLMSPEVLIDSGVPCCRLVQYPGEFVVTFPRAYHVGFSHGFNCGEAANFATPQWLKFAKEAAVRRAVMNYLPMLSHQQLLYLLAVSFISRNPRELLTGIRTSRLRDRKKEERELLVKQEFLQDMISENELLCSFLEKKSVNNVVLWEPDLLPSLTALHPCSSALKVHEKKGEDGPRIEPAESNSKDNCSSDGTEYITGTISKGLSTDSKQAPEGEKLDTDDDDDLPFDLSIDSGSLTCVACGILGYPFMAILQPSRKALEEISLVDKERYKVSCEKENSSNVLPCSPNDGSSGCSLITSKSSSPVENANFSHQNLKPNRSDTSLKGKEFDGTLGKHSSTSCSCSSGDTIDPYGDTETPEKKIPSDGPFSELSKQTDRGHINVQAVEVSDGTMRWNTGCTFARPRIFCLQHALEIEELLASKGGVHTLIICHADYVKLKALAISIAEEIEFHFDYKDVALANASKSDLHLINISIDDEGYEEEGTDWTSRMGLNLKHCSKIRKETSGSQKQPPLSFWGLFSKPSPISVVPNLKWLCRKARTPYKVVGYTSSPDVVAAPDKVKPAVTKSPIDTADNAHENVKSEQTLQKVCVLKETSDVADMSCCPKENDQDGHSLINIPIAVAEYPMMHQVCEGPVSVSSFDDPICSFDSQGAPTTAAVSAAKPTREQCDVESTELTSSSNPVQQFLDNELTVERSSMNLVSNHEYLESDNATSVCKEEQLQVQEDQEAMEPCNNPITDLVRPCLTEGITFAGELHGGAASSTLENEDSCGNTSYHSDTVLKDSKSDTDGQPETCAGSAVLVTPKSSCDQMISSGDRSCSLIVDFPVSSDAAVSSEKLSMAHGLMSTQAVRNSKAPLRSLNPEQAEASLTDLKAAKVNCIHATQLPHECPSSEFIISEGTQKSASVTAISGQNETSMHRESNSFDILLGVLANESKVASGKDEIGKASLTLMTLASNDHSADDVTQGKVIIDRSRDFCASDIVSRSIGSSNRTNIIFYTRRKLKRKNRSKSNINSLQSIGSYVRSPCESLRPRTRPAIVEDMENETKSVEASVAKKRKRTKLESFRCEIEFCDMTFETKAELRAHQRNICTDESCGKRFSSHKYLKRHQCVHRDERPFKCPWDGCPMTFKWLWAQTEHIRVHTGERPYKCAAPDCGQSFRYVSDYSRHRKKFNHY
ncbi:lysine-specific demethylase SE14 [Oryza brachyantha]|uniref:lysine-specific demethylase SE14 n=1 Tax=Oryza brachyantha TaxID=4533 RepID=UPI001ADD232D|nr:lysine-specific demethylase SE14 [Oryza brachyantha]